MDDSGLDTVGDFFIREADYFWIAVEDWHPTTDYTDCFEGPVAWAKAQGWTVDLITCKQGGRTEVWNEDQYHAIDADTPDAICEAIYEAWMASK